MRAKLKARLTGLVIAALLAPAPALAQATNTIHRERSQYRDIMVTQQGNVRCMVFRIRKILGHESCKDLTRPRLHIFPYTRMMMAGLFLNPQPRRILIVGLGGGTMSDTLARIVPGAVIDNVELDPAVASIAQRFFGFRTNNRVSVTVQDGRVFVKRRMRTNIRYDMVMLDAFDGDYIPEHLLTQNFFREVRSIMTPDGVFVANGYASGRLYPYESVTYRSVFGPFYNMKAGNRVVVAKLGAQVPMATIQRNAAALAPALAEMGTTPRQMIGLMSTQVDWDTNTPLLTDQYSPANVLNSQGRQ